MSYLFTFLEGLASFISPCVLPMIPIYISYFAGKEDKKTKTVINSVSFVVGFSIVFILLAIIANKAGNTIISYIKYAKYLFGIIVIILGLNYMELISLNIFKGINKFKVDLNNLNIVKSILFGMLFSISLTPCIGTFLASALLLIAGKESLIEGLILIILYCIGLGVPFIISAILIDKLKNAFMFLKKNFKIIKIISGIILIIMGIYLIFF